MSECLSLLFLLQQPVILSRLAFGTFSRQVYTSTFVFCCSGRNWSKFGRRRRNEKQPPIERLHFHCRQIFTVINSSLQATTAHEIELRPFLWGVRGRRAHQIAVVDSQKRVQEVFYANSKLRASSAYRRKIIFFFLVVSRAGSYRSTIGNHKKNVEPSYF